MRRIVVPIAVSPSGIADAQRFPTSFWSKSMSLSHKCRAVTHPRVRTARMKPGAYFRDLQLCLSSISPIHG